jgi:hypothetical protein
MEMTLFLTINDEAPVNAADAGVQTLSDLVILDDSKLRLVGGGHVSVLQY